MDNIIIKGIFLRMFPDKESTVLNIPAAEISLSIDYLKSQLTKEQIQELVNLAEPEEIEELKGDWVNDKQAFSKVLYKIDQLVRGYNTLRNLIKRGE